MINHDINYRKVIISSSYHTPGPTSRTRRSFHTSSPNVQNFNDSNNFLVIGSLVNSNFLFKVIKLTIILKIQRIKKKTNKLTNVLWSNNFKLKQ